MASAVEILALEAMAWAMQRDDQRGCYRIVQAVCLAEPAGFVRLFADAGVAMARLLEALVAA